MHYSLPKTGALGHPSSLMSPLVTADNHIAPHQQSTRETELTAGFHVIYVVYVIRIFSKK